MSEPKPRKWQALGRTAAFIAIALIVGFAAGHLWRGGAPPPASANEADHPHDEAQPTKWYCAMDPEVPQTDKPGKCPKCGMALVKVPSATGDGDLGPRELKLSPTAQKLAAVETALVERKFVEAELRMVGKIDYDESRVRNITAWVGGRLDRLFVDYTGVPVRKGDHLVEIYSPELLTAQEQLLQAIKTVAALKNSKLPGVSEGAEQTVLSLRDKLRLWGLKQEQIAGIEKTGKPLEHVTIYAPLGGIVVEKKALEGNYVKIGAPIYTIADFSQVWAMLDAYESDLDWIRYGQQVAVETEAYSSDTFTGRISFIDPVLNDKTRTVKVRVNLPNADGRLKPGMFVRAFVRATVANDGKVMAPALAGKWTCTMHPDVIEDNAGKCPQCEMPLVRTESLNYLTGNGQHAPLVIPVSAPLITGKRAVVYVAHPEKEGVFEGREIELGPRAGDYYLVKSGLQEGERVVTKGNFKIDSAMQIMAKPSMMKPSDEGGGAGSGSKTKPPPGQPKEKLAGPFETPEAFRQQIDGVLNVYFRIQQALSQDDPKAAQAAGPQLQKALEAVDMKLLKGDAHLAWMKERAVLSDTAKDLGAEAGIVKQREVFDRLSETLISIVKSFGAGGTVAVLQFNCPMAFNNRGANWLQNKAATENPYFGDAMFSCGAQTATIVPVKKEGDAEK